jgi:alpha-beta hydrolase superfamily lysophospholipase
MRIGAGEPYIHAFPQPDQGAEAVVCIVHGMGEHGGRYGHVADVLREAGFAVYAIDQQGHGHASGKRGHAKSVLHLADDAARMVEQASQRHPGLPVFLYGHSMGGNVALSCALRLRPAIAGLILSSPWLRLAFDPPSYKVAVGRAIGAVWPSLTMPTGLKGGSLYRNEKLRLDDQKDRLLHNRISASLFFSLRDEGERSIRAAAGLDVPLLLLHGTADGVTSYAATRELASRLSGTCTFLSREGGYHELHNDEGAEEVLAEVASWIKLHADRMR